MSAMTVYNAPDTRPHGQDFGRYADVVTDEAA